MSFSANWLCTKFADTKATNTKAHKYMFRLDIVSMAIIMMFPYTHNSNALCEEKQQFLFQNELNWYHGVKSNDLLLEEFCNKCSFDS